VNIPAQAANPLLGEEVWLTVASDAAGNPVIEEAALRPDAQHTSELAYAAWMNQKALASSLPPGYQQPGGNWRVQLPRSAYRGTLWPKLVIYLASRPDK
jgi:hypothetical protein